MCWWCSWWSARGCQGFHKEAWWEWDQVHKTWQMHCWLFLRQRYILSNGVGNLTSQWRHFWFTSQHQSDLNYITHNSGSHYYFYYRSHQHTRTWNKNIYIAIKDYPEIRVWSYLPQVDTVSENDPYIMIDFAVKSVGADISMEGCWIAEAAWRIFFK